MMWLEAGFIQKTDVEEFKFVTTISIGETSYKNQ